MSKGKPTLKKNKEITFLLEESIPKDATGRKQYVSDIAYFYATTFKEKLKHFIGLQLIELAQIGRSEKESNIIRANINCFNLIDDWMDKETKEHFGDLEQLRNSFDNNDDFINKLKDEYKV